MLNPLACSWENASFLTISSNISEKVVYYAHYGPLLLILAMVVFIWFFNRKEFLSRAFLFILASMVLWIINDIYQWFAVDGGWIMFAWATQVFFEMSIYLSILYFVYLFIQDKTPAFWMKNTLIPLDMVFIDEKGLILGIHNRAIPHNLTPISPSGPVKAVLEINGGQAEKLGLRVGDPIISSSLTN